MESFKEMGQGDTWKLLVRYSLPAIAGMMLISLYNVVDRIFVGQATGAVGLAAVTIALPVMMLGFAGALMANAGGSSLISRLLGKGDKAGAEKAIMQSALLGGAVSTAVGLACLPILTPMLHWFGATAETVGQARTFSLIVIASFPLQGVSMGLGAGVRSQGKAKTSMFLMLAGVLVNTGLCALFVSAWGWGVAGSAWATFWSQVFSVAISLAFYLSGAGSLRLHWRNLRFEAPVCAEVAKVGLGAGISNIIPVFLFIILNNLMLNLAGTVGIAMIGVVNTISMLAVMPIFGIMQGAAPIMGYNHGHGSPARVRRVFLQSLAASTAILLVFWGLVELFPDALLRAFAGNDAQLVELGRRGVTVFMLLLPIVGLPVALTQYYQSVGKGLASAVLGMSRQVIFLIPALLVLPRFLGVDGVLWSGPVSDGLGVLLTLAFFVYEMPRLNRSVREAAAAPRGVASAADPAERA